MNQHEPKWRMPSPGIQPGKVLETYYSQLLKWGAILTRGDAGVAQDIVHEFCLYFTLTKPDVSEIGNLDNYLYTCLRHVYLSTMNRSTRDALSLVSISEFDSIKLALSANRAGDLLQKQNDLRRICCFSVWRKAHTKSASYFILRFFHGYHYQEIADIGHHPLAAIYNHLKVARSEVRSYLQEPGKLQFANRENPPAPALVWAPVSSLALFKELRQSILASRSGDCLSEERLLAHYREERPRAISCSLLSHIVSCERCLAIVDRHFGRPTLHTREPLDGVGSGDGSDGLAPEGREPNLDAMLRLVRKDRDETQDHRPRTLCIAVDGKILASHDIEALRNTLSARVDRPDQCSFVEVFSDQGIRLALMPIGAMPPDGPHKQAQRVQLNDDRWLELRLTFDGLGMNTEVIYIDPALAADATAGHESPALTQRKPDQFLNSTSSGLPGKRLFAAAARLMSGWAPTPAFGYALVLTAALAGGYLAYRYAWHAPALSAQSILDQSVHLEEASLQLHTEHQVLQIETADPAGTVRQRGTVDLWKDGNGTRYMRRLYDEQHHLLAAEWQQPGSDQREYLTPSLENNSEADAEMLQQNLWRWDMSSSGFRESLGAHAQARSASGGYELSAEGPTTSQPQLVSATLVLDQHLHPTRETLELRTGSGTRVVRLLEADYARLPSSSVPDAVFELPGQGAHSDARRLPAPMGAFTDTALTQLHVAVLYQLNNLAAEGSDQIEVRKTHQRAIEVSGIVADDGRKKAIVSQLNLLENHRMLQIRLVTPRDLQKHSGPSHELSSEMPRVYEMRETSAPADGLLRRHFEAQGFSGSALDSVVTAFSAEVLEHAKHSLQHAAALEGLGSTFPAAELATMNFTSRAQWSEMVARHALALERELRALRRQLDQLPEEPSPQRSTIASTNTPIDSPTQFTRAAAQILLDTQAMNRQIGNAFTAHQADGAHTEAHGALESATKAIPLQAVEQVTTFAAKLNAAARTAQTSRQHSRSDPFTP
jgi:DNA-directed RNA polymerase specialized sigma24 family protein